MYIDIGRANYTRKENLLLEDGGAAAGSGEDGEDSSDDDDNEVRRDGWTCGIKDGREVELVCGCEAEVVPLLVSFF